MTEKHYPYCGGSFDRKEGYELWKAYPVKGGMVKRPYVFNL